MYFTIGDYRRAHPQVENQRSGECGDIRSVLFGILQVVAQLVAWGQHAGQHRIGAGKHYPGPGGDNYAVAYREYGG